MKQYLTSFKGIIGMLFIGIGLVSWLFFGEYAGSAIPHPFLFYLGSISLVIIGWLTLRKVNKRSADSQDESTSKAIAQLKHHGAQIPVKLEDCEILTNNYSIEVETPHVSLSPILTVLTDHNKNVKHVDINQAVLVYETELKGKKTKFNSPLIRKDEITLRFLLDFQKETTIYVDNIKNDIYYFDLEFLEK